jgi:16S rRNA (cytosine1402-N4)-methyltransferase
MYHKPVLLNECIEGLAIRSDGTYVDVTFGGGGHSKEILRVLGEGRLVAFDQDEDALANKLDDDRFTLVNSNFKYLKNFLQLHRVVPVDGVLADLGISSHQIDDAGRGFSTRFEAELDMRMDRKQSLSAKDLVNNSSFEELRSIFSLYGELKNAGRIASIIVKERSENEIISTNQLKEVLNVCAPRNKEQKFFAQVFQALRIEVNEELLSLKEMLKQSLEVLKPGGRLVVMSYHSLEDRLVKNFIKTGNFEGKLKKDFYGNPIVDFRLINRKPITPSEKELEENSRSRSAKLRIVEKI